MTVELNSNHTFTNAGESQRREALPLPITGIILCGGKSKRMGRPKAFLPYNGGSFIEHQLGIFASMFDETFLVTNDTESFSHLSVNVVKDILPQRGPVCGILSGLLVAANQYCFVVACDMPLIDKRLLREMSQQRHNLDVVVLSHTEGVEPLFGLYSKSCIPSLEEALFSGDTAVADLIVGLKTKTFNYDEFDFSPAKDDLPVARKHVLPAYFNVNTPTDYSVLLNS